MMTDIEIFPWNDNFDTGIAIIDEQHKKLVSLLNELARHLACRSDIPTLNAIFVELTEYASYHFKTEEEIWHQFLPHAELELKHKKTHCNFILEVLKLKEEELSTPLEQVIEDILSFLTHWLVFHILDEDKRLAKVVLAIQSGLTLEQAIEKSNRDMDKVMKLLIESILSMYDNLSCRTLQLAKEIAARQKAESKQMLAASVFENTFDAICITDAEGNIVDANPSFYQTTGHSYQEVLGQSLKAIKSGLADVAASNTICPILHQENHWSGKVSNRNKNGELIPEWLTCSVIKNEMGEITHYVGIFSNISFFIQQQHNLEHIAHHDVLTNLPNRLLLYDRLELAINHSIRSKTALAVCYLDLDGFKPVNDNFGHVAGDLVLQEVAKRLLAAVRNEDTVARLGGDEFVVLFGNLKETRDCAALLDRIMEGLACPITLDNDIAVNISASIGCTFFPQDTTDPQLLIQHADQAMYQAKRLGKNQYYFYQPAP